MNIKIIHVPWKVAYVPNIKLKAFTIVTAKIVVILNIRANINK